MTRIETIPGSGDRRGDGGKVSHVVMRRCIATGQVMPRSELLRLALGPNGELLPDVAGKLPGRGLWITPAKDAIARACKKNLFAKAARAPVKVNDSLAEQAETLLAQRCLECLGLARRAGQVVAGFEKAKAWIKAGKVGVLVQARDGSLGGRHQLRDLAAKQPGARIVDKLFSRSELGQALGREEAVHIAVASSSLADRFAAECARLGALRGAAGPESKRSA